MRNVFTIIEDLVAGLSDLKTALQPLAAFALGTKPQRGRPRSANRRESSVDTKISRSSAKPAKSPARKARKAVSPKVRAMRVQQGKYLAALRGLTVQQRAQVKKAKADGDYGSALKLASSMGKKRQSTRPKRSARRAKTAPRPAETPTSA